MTGDVTTDSPAEPNVLMQREGRVGIIVLNRPRARNALNNALLGEFWAAIEELTADPGVGAIILTGAGPAFCAGADLKEGASAELADLDARAERVNRSMRIYQTLPRLPKPVIAAVNGPAVAGGCGVAMSCDLVIASDQAAFGFPEVAKGLVAAMVMVSLSRIVGRRQALELLLTARTLSAEDALGYGLINRIVPHEELMSEAVRYAAQIAGNSATALRITKDLYRQVTEMDYDRALEYARDVNLLVSQSRDGKQGMADFANRKEVPGK